MDHRDIDRNPDMDHSFHKRHTMVRVNASGPRSKSTSAITEFAETADPVDISPAPVFEDTTTTRAGVAGGGIGEPLLPTVTRRGWPPRTLRGRVYAVVGALLLLLLVTAATTTVVRLRVSSAGNRLTQTLRPAQVAAAGLVKSYVDEETGERGFLLTGDAGFLLPYRSGIQDAQRFRAQLDRLFAGDTGSAVVLSAVDSAAAGWREHGTTPEITAFEAGTLIGRSLAASVSRGQTLYDVLRARLARLQDRVDDLVAVAVQNSAAAQRAANEVTVAAALAVLLLAALVVRQLRTSFARPLGRLVTQVRRVADGDLDHVVDASGPVEIATVGTAVEAMRLRIVAESVRATTSARQVARYEEAERIAHHLGDTVLRQLFTTSLGLQSTASRYPAAAQALTTAIGDIDQAMRELQSAVFGLTPGPSAPPLDRQVLDLVDRLTTGLGEAPEVHLAGDLDDSGLLSSAADVTAVVREVIQVAGAAGSSVSLSRTADALLLRLTVRSAGFPPSDSDLVAGVVARARHRGGDCTVLRDAARATVDWRVPLPAEGQSA